MTKFLITLVFLLPVGLLPMQTVCLNSVERCCTVYIYKVPNGDSKFFLKANLVSALVYFQFVETERGTPNAPSAELDSGLIENSL